MRFAQTFFSQQKLQHRWRSILLHNVVVARNVAMFVAIGLATSFAHAAVPLFHLDFSADTIVDVSSNAMPISVGANVSRLAGAGPNLSGGTIDSGEFPLLRTGDNADDGIQVINPVLDAIANSHAGSTVAWMKVYAVRRNAIFTQDIFTLEGSIGMEFQSKRNSSNGGGDVFGYTQGWRPADGEPPREAWGPGDPGGPDNTPVDVWTHLAMTWNDQGDVTIHVNGLAGTTNVSGRSFTANPGNIQWQIGTGLVASEKGLFGELADLAFYDVELNAGQIADIMADGVAASSTGGQDGDFDGDLDVDGADFLKWQRDSGDAAELALWETNFGTTASAAAVAAVPEPTAGLLLIVGLGLLAARRRS